MTPKQLGQVFFKEGYRFCKANPQEAGIYYKYYKEGFQVVITVDLSDGYRMTPKQHEGMVERTMSIFYHPQGKLSDFPDGFPVYHVEVLTILIGGDMELQRGLCAQCKDIWGCLCDGRLLIYENQPGDFFGLRMAIENFQPDLREEWGKERIKATLEEKIKAIKLDRNMPYVTVALIMVNVVVYLIMEFIGHTTDGAFVAAWGGMYPTFLKDEHQWWRLLTAGFIHFGAAHLVNNMFIFFCMGPRLERETGHIRMFLIYIISLLGGSLFSYAAMIHTGDYAVSAGASGAVFGVIGGFLWIVILHRGHLQGITAKGIVFMLALTIYYGFTSNGIDNWGHIGGVVTGFAITVILYHRKRQKY